MNPVILAILQNQWFRDPERAKRALDSFVATGGDRRAWIKTLLFWGCLTGRRLKAAFGDRIDDITFDEASPLMSGKASACPPADPDHIARTLMDVKPDIVLVFGAVANRGYHVARELVDELDAAVIIGPHPAARHRGVCDDLNAMAAQLEAQIATRRGEAA